MAGGYPTSLGSSVYGCRSPLLRISIVRPASVGLTISTLIRRRIKGWTVISRTDTETASGIDRLGPILSSTCTPKGHSWPNSEERKRWRALGAAKALYRSGTRSN